MNEWAVWKASIGAVLGIAGRTDREVRRVAAVAVAAIFGTAASSLLSGTPPPWTAAGSLTVISVSLMALNASTPGVVHVAATPRARRATLLLGTS